MKTNIWVTGAVMATLLVAPSTLHASEVKIDNTSNGKIFVAIAYKNWNNGVGIEGWHTIGSNESRTFTAPDGCDMYIRVEREGGKEINWANHKTYWYWSVTGE